MSLRALARQRGVSIATVQKALNDHYGAAYRIIAVTAGTGLGVTATRAAPGCGWFSGPRQQPEQPEYDPPHDAPCRHCGAALDAADVRTHSFVARHGGPRSYFYRTHRSCDE